MKYIRPIFANIKTDFEAIAASKVDFYLFAYIHNNTYNRISNTLYPIVRGILDEVNK